MSDGSALIVVGGPNGAGKTTFARAYVEAYDWPYLGADEIAEELAPGDWESVRVEAGRRFLQGLTEAIAGGESLVVESTLSGRGLLRTLSQAHQAGYRVSIVFVFLESADQCVARVRERVLKGGHAVPEADVRRRFRRSLVNFWNLYRLHADEWFLYYNSDGELECVAFGDDTSVEVYTETIWNLFWSTPDDH